jgi:hypothetical protein
MGLAISITCLNLLNSVHMKGLSGKYDKLPKPVLKLAMNFGRRLHRHLEKMTISKIKPIFKIGDLVHLESYNIYTVLEDGSKKIGVIVSEAKYDQSYSYQDWIMFNEPLYDVQFGSDLKRAIPQRFLDHVSREESSN